MAFNEHLFWPGVVLGAIDVVVYYTLQTSR